MLRRVLYYSIYASEMTVALFLVGLIRRSIGQKHQRHLLLKLHPVIDLLYDPCLALILVAVVQINSIRPILHVLPRYALRVLEVHICLVVVIAHNRPAL
jgi:hypothetical protein